MRAYDAAGIADRQSPPRALTLEASSADLVLSSDLPRALETAARLGMGREIVVSPLLREAHLDIPAWLPLRWPLFAWELLITAQWGHRILRGVDAGPEELSRAGEAARWVHGCASHRGTTIAVTHGVFRRLLARSLLDLGWREHSPTRSYAPWSAWTLVYPTSAA